jgi:hypothetical protein
MRHRHSATLLALAMVTAARALPLPEQPMLGEAAPAFRLPDVRTGKSLALEELRGRFVVLHFGASW